MKKITLLALLLCFSGLSGAQASTAVNVCTSACANAYQACLAAGGSDKVCTAALNACTATPPPKS